MSWQELSDAENETVMHGRMLRMHVRLKMIEVNKLIGSFVLYESASQDPKALSVGQPLLAPYPKRLNPKSPHPHKP